MKQNFGENLQRSPDADEEGGEEKEKKEKFFEKMDKILQALNTDRSYDSLINEMEKNKILFKEELGLDVNLEYAYPYFDKESDKTQIVDGEKIGINVNHVWQGFSHIKTDRGLICDDSEYGGHSISIDRAGENMFNISGSGEEHGSEVNVVVSGKDAELVKKMISKMHGMVNMELGGRERYSTNPLEGSQSAGVESRRKNYDAWMKREL